MYALYAWGNFIHEVELDREPAWLDPAVLSGERDDLGENLTILDTGLLRFDGPNTIFEVDGQLVLGSDLVGRDLSGAQWRVARIRVATDGSREDALRVTDGIDEDDNDFYVDEDEPSHDPLLPGRTVITWEDEHGQWDLALVEI